MVVEYCSACELDYEFWVLGWLSSFNFLRTDAGEIQTVV